MYGLYKNENQTQFGCVVLWVEYLRRLITVSVSGPHTGYPVAIGRMPRKDGAIRTDFFVKVRQVTVLY